jgi:hypothetical protein
MLGFGFFWGSSVYWSPSEESAQTKREDVRKHAEEVGLDWPSRVTPFHRDFYEETLIIE